MCQIHIKIIIIIIIAVIVVDMEFFPSSGHMIGSKRSRPTSASSRKGSSGIVCGGQRSRPGRWKTRSTRSLVGSSDGDGVRAGVVSELDIFYFRKMAISLQVRRLGVCVCVYTCVQCVVCVCVYM